MNLDQLRELLGWCCVINSAILLLSTVVLMCFQQVIMKIHGKLMGMDERDLKRVYFTYLANFKIMVICFNLVPYIALILMKQ